LKYAYDSDLRESLPAILTPFTVRGKPKESVVNLQTQSKARRENKKAVFGFEEKRIYLFSSLRLIVIV
jgi:hypothetical protein